MQRRNPLLTISLLVILSILLSLPLYWHNQSNRTTPLTGGTPEKSTSDLSKAVLRDFPRQRPLTPQTGPYSVAAEPALDITLPQSEVLEEELIDVDVAGVISSLDIEVSRNVSDDFRTFVENLQGGEPGVPIGVYIEDTLALEIEQQPEDNNAYVPPEWGKASQFRSADRYGVTGLLAHNYLSGSDFYNIQLDQEVRVVYGEGLVRLYQVKEIRGYQKLEPTNLTSDLVELDTGKRVTTPEVFGRFYQGDHRVTFQTCLARDNLSNWGLTFITAEPTGEFFLP